MKPVLLAMLCHAFVFHMNAGIKNGYATALAAARARVLELREGLSQRTDLSRSQRRKVAAAIAQQLELITQYQLTESLLKQFRAISPAMYEEMDNIRDKRGRPTDIYIRFIRRESGLVPMSGASFFQRSSLDDDANHSRYGEFSVAIDIWICDTSLNLLAHELGHTRYIVPNLAEYRNYYRRAYSHRMSVAAIGHHATDRSGRLANEYGSRFLRDRRDFRLKFGHGPQDLATTLRNVKRELRDEMNPVHKSSWAAVARP